MIVQALSLEMNIQRSSFPKPKLTKIHRFIIISFVYFNRVFKDNS